MSRGELQESPSPVRKSGWAKQVAGGLKGGSPFPKSEHCPRDSDAREMLSKPSDELEDTAGVDRCLRDKLGC